MEIIVKGTQAECDKVRKCISELSAFEQMIIPFSRVMLGVNITADFSYIFTTDICYEVTE